MNPSDRDTLPDLLGLVLVDKPEGITSHDIVSRVRRLVGMKRVGHGGTLDPFATGLVIVAVGRATRLLQYVQDDDKRYLAHVVLGATTDTGDVDGVVVSRSTATDWPDLDVVKDSLRRFLGEIDQYPPAHSAIKVGGRKLYELARAGEPVDVPLRRVTIASIDVVRYDPPDLILDIRCGKGTYIRSLARDIGDRLGTGGYCHALRRTESGGFSLDGAWTLEDLSDRNLREEWSFVAVHPDRAVLPSRAALLTGDQEAEWSHGRSVSWSDRGSALSSVPVLGYSRDGRFLGIGMFDERGDLAPRLVIPSPLEDGKQ